MNIAFPVVSVGETGVERHRQRTHRHVRRHSTTPLRRRYQYWDLIAQLMYKWFDTVTSTHSYLLRSAAMVAVWAPFQHWSGHSDWAHDNPKLWQRESAEDTACSQYRDDCLSRQYMSEEVELGNTAGNDLSTLFAPLIRDGRMQKFYWDPNLEEKTFMVYQMYKDDGLSFQDVIDIIDCFKHQPLDFFGAIRAGTYDRQILYAS
jgi:hypothetical protein